MKYCQSKKEYAKNIVEETEMRYHHSSEKKARLESEHTEVKYLSLRVKTEVEVR